MCFNSNTFYDLILKPNVFLLCLLPKEICIKSMKSILKRHLSWKVLFYFEILLKDIKSSEKRNTGKPVLSSTAQNQVEHHKFMACREVKRDVFKLVLPLNQKTNNPLNVHRWNDSSLSCKRIHYTICWDNCLNLSSYLINEKIKELNIVCLFAGSCRIWRHGVA